MVLPSFFKSFICSQAKGIARIQQKAGINKADPNATKKCKSEESQEKIKKRVTDIEKG